MESSAEELTFSFSVHYPNTVDGPTIGPDVVPAPDSEDESALLSLAPSIPSLGGVSGGSPHTLAHSDGGSTPTPPTDSSVDSEGAPL